MLLLCILLVKLCPPFKAVVLNLSYAPHPFKTFVVPINAIINNKKIVTG